MFSGSNITKSSVLVERALEARTTRQKLIAGNIANIDTPFYKARDIDFETALSEKKAEIYGQNSKEAKFELAVTHEKHVGMLEFPKSDASTIFLRDGHMQRNDANTVDLDVETSELSKNSIMVQGLDAANSKFKSIFKEVIDSSAKI